MTPDRPKPPLQAARVAPHRNGARRALPARFILTLLLTACAGGTAAGLSLDPSLRITQYALDIWTTEQGLPSNSITSVQSTRDGYLWLTTYTGIVRFDGHRFECFNTANTKSLETNSFVTMVEDREGVLWFGSNAGGIYTYKNGSFTRVDTAIGLSDNLIRALLVDADGRIWVGTQRALHVIADGRFTTRLPEVNEPAATYQILSLYLDRRGRIWVGTKDHGLIRFDGPFVQRFTTAEGLPGNQVFSVFEDTTRRFWVCVYGVGLFELRNDREFVAAPFSERIGPLVTCTYERMPGVLWVGTERGLHRLADGGHASLTKVDGFPETTIRNIFQDDEGHLWLGTMRAGLARLRAGKFVTWTEREGLAGDIIHCIHQHTDGTVWFGTQDGLSRLASGVVTSITAASGLIPSNLVRDVISDRDGGLWVATYEGLARLAPDGTARIWTTADGLPSNQVRVLLFDRFGRLWIGTRNGICRMESGNPADHALPANLPPAAGGSTGSGASGTAAPGSHPMTVEPGPASATPAPAPAGRRPPVVGTGPDPVRFVPVGQHQGLGRELILCLFEDRQGHIWIGTDGNGLHRLAGDETTAFRTRDGLAGDIVFKVHQDPQGDMWAATVNGISRIRGREIRSFRTTDGLGSDVVFQLFEDRIGLLWMTTSNGIFCVSRHDLNDVALGRMRTVRHTAFGRSDGMKTSECTGTSKGLFDSQGRLWIPTVRGVAVIDPLRVPINRRVPPVNIEQVEIGDTWVQPRQGMKLPPDTRRLAFAYTALCFGAPEKVQFKYRLEGLDDDWIDAGTRRVAYYTNLPAGPYVFRVIACNNDGFWNETGARLEFTREPWFHETPTFYLCLAGAFLLFTFGLVRLRMRALRVRTAELEAAVRSRTVEIEQQKQEIGRQNEENQRLLRNILPEAIADRLRRGEPSIADSFPEVSVIFADIVGFTSLAESLPARNVVSLLNELFSQFDAIAAHFGVEKIKTVGDGYMAAAGLPIPDPDHAAAAARTALGMLEAMNHFNRLHGGELDLRIGIASGPVVAGVIGTNKFAYDLWGDAVNLASRMESHGECGAIQIAETTFRRLRKQFKCQPRGLIDIKGKGPMPTYLLIGEIETPPAAGPVILGDGPGVAPKPQVSATPPAPNLPASAPPTPAPSPPPSPGSAPTEERPNPQPPPPPPGPKPTPSEQPHPQAVPAAGESPSETPLPVPPTATDHGPPRQDGSRADTPQDANPRRNP